MRSDLLKRAAITVTAIATMASVALSPVVFAGDATPVPFSPGAGIAEMKGEVLSDGSSTVGPITEAVAEEFLAVAPGVATQVDISGTGGGFKRFCAGETDLQNASRSIKDEEKALCAEGGVDYFAFEVAYDGLAVLVNPENDWVECLTVEQLNKIWMLDSTVSKWSDVDPSWPAETINLYGPGTDSGTYDYFTKEINGEEGVSTTNYQPSEDDNVLVEGVAGDKYALGFFGLAYYEQNQDKLKLVGVDGGAGCVTPSAETVQSLEYAPLSRPLFVYVNYESLARPEVQEFMRFYLANASVLAAEVGYVASPIETILADQVKLEGAIDGSVEPEGSAAAA